MLKKRLVASLTVRNGIVVQTVGFKQFLPVGSPLVAAKFLNQWGIDEIAILDIDATPNQSPPNFRLVKAISRQIFVPLSVGGGIKSTSDIRRLIKGGADKIILNTTIFDNSNFISAAAEILGAQSVVASIDVKKVNGRYQVYSRRGRLPTGLDPVAWAKKIETLGAGEILLRSIDRDGSKKGFDTDLIKKLVNTVKIPLIAAGGAGRPEHFLQAFKSGAAAAAAGNFFHFTEHSPILVKSYLKSQGVNVRLDTHAKYRHVKIDPSGRLLKSSDAYLEDLKFQIIRPETI